MVSDFPLAVAAVNVTVESVTFEGVKYMSLVTRFVSLPASMNLSCWSLASKSVTSLLPLRSANPLITAFCTVAPFVLSVSSTFSLRSVTSVAFPDITSWKRAVVSVASAWAFALAAAASATCFAAAFFFSTLAMESCTLCCWAISSSDGLLYQLKPMSNAAMSTKPVMVFLSIVKNKLFF